MGRRDSGKGACGRWPKFPAGRGQDLEAAVRGVWGSLTYGMRWLGRVQFIMHVPSNFRRRSSSAQVDLAVLRMPSWTK
eukprot:4331852-Prymnesium_polylepis.1